MKDGKCSKGFPKPFQAETVMTQDGYPIYARLNDGCVYEVRHFFADNWWIVPYNPYLLSQLVFPFSVNLTLIDIFINRYNAHMNVECVMSLAAAKYITKYTHKGPDCATVEF